MKSFVYQMLAWGYSWTTDREVKCHITTATQFNQDAMVCYWYCTEKWQVPQQHPYFTRYYSLDKDAWRAVLQHFLTIEFVTP